MNESKSRPVVQPSVMRLFWWMALCLVLLLGFLFRDGLLPDRTVFSNDGPLGALMSECRRLPAGFFSYWQDLNWIGGSGPSASLSISNALALICGPLLLSKIFEPFALLFLGLSAWLCFRQWKLSPLACLLGGIAATLNSDFFSTACWGVATQPLSFGCDFLALAALADQTSPKRWVRVALAGFAVGMGVMEAFDIGAIFSLVVAAFVVFQALAEDGTTPRRLTAGVMRLAVVVAFAGFIALSAVSTLVSTQIKGVAGMGQDAASKAQHWDEATMWSMPKAEALSMIVPGLFGYRMDTPDGGNYWGRCGRDQAWDRYFASGKQGPPPRSPIRYGGGGVYTGVLVVLVALWTVLQAFRKQNLAFSLTERKFIWFWTGLGLLCVLVGFGRYAPFYQLFYYAVPFASTMRNPSKFFHVVEWTLVILFAYGVEGLSRSWRATPAGVSRGLSAQLRAWWAKASVFDKNWIKGSVLALAASLLGWLIYSRSHDRLVAYLQEVRFDATLADAIASFSIRQVGWFILFLVLALGLLAVSLSGYFSGRRARLGGILLGILLVADLGRADMPWVVTWNWVQKYATNPVIDFLREKPYEHRVAVLPFSPPPRFELFSQLYDIEWKQQLFQYYNIQSLDWVMNPRPREDEIAFETALFFNGTTNTLDRIARRWQLTNTRYLLGAAGYLDVLNQQIDPIKHRFRIVTRFDVAAKPGIPNPTGLDELTAVINPEGPYALFEFTGALPRAKLYSNWQVSTNDQVTLTNLASPAFDPQQTVLVANPSVPNPPPPASLNAFTSTNSVEFVHYEPRRIILRGTAANPAVLLLNDRYDPNWKVWVDGRPAALLRCNYLMRGVYLQAGPHTVEFRFEPPAGALYVSMTAVFIGLLLLGYLAVGRRQEAAAGPTGGTSPAKESRLGR